jgi:hypothetical protein
VKNWNKSLSWLRTLLLAAIAMFSVAAPIPSLAQSCALCYTQAASSGSKMIQALRSGILILIIPPTLGTIGLILVVHRRTNQVRRDTDEADNEW